MHVFHRARRGVPLAVAFALAAPAVAQAEVTSSNVTTPSNPTYLLNDQTDVPVATTTVAGTTNGTTGDTVDLRCRYDQTSYNTVASGVPVNADGSFSTEVDLDMFPDDACTLHAVDGSVGTSEYFRYDGPLVAVSRIEGLTTVPDGPNAGLVTDYDVRTTGIGGYFDLSSAGEQGIRDSAGYAPDLDEASGGWDEAAELGGKDEDGSGIRNQLLVDGRNAYTPDQARDAYFGDGAPGGPLDSYEAPGLPGITLTASVSGTSVIVTETFALVRCNNADTTEPDATNCSEWLPTGVRVVRRWEVREGHTAFLSDTYESADGAAHSIDPIYFQDVETSEIGWQIDGSEEFVHYEGVTLGNAELPDRPFGMSAMENDDDPDGIENYHVGVAFAEPPQEIRFTEEEEFEAAYGARQVPASLRHAFTQGVNSTQTRRRTQVAADSYAAPVVAIATPAEGATVSSDNVDVVGSVFDVEVASVNVNGVPAVVGVDGSFIASVPLTPGVNTITATAVDTAGQTGTATRTVNYSPGAARVAPAGLTRRVTPKRDRKAPFAFRVLGRLVLPQGITSGDACSGDVIVVTRAGKNAISARTASVTGDCRYASPRIKFGSRKRFGKGRKKLSVQVRFTGNRVLLPTAAKKASFRVR